jgi:hypothetical protein
MYRRVNKPHVEALITFSPKKSLSKHINMGANFEDLVETNLLEKRISNQSCRFGDKMF